MNNALFLCLLFLSFPLLAGKLYKVVDVDGNVTFSQFPPKEAVDGVKVETMKVKGARQAAVTHSGGKSYCGDIKLPEKSKYSSRNDYFLSNLVRSNKYWKKRLQSLEANIDRNSKRQLKNNEHLFRNGTHRQNVSANRYKTNSYSSANSEYVQRNLAEVRNLRCAIQWADDFSQEKYKNNKSVKSELERLQGIHDRLSKKMNNECGSKPVFDPSNYDYKENMGYWRSCTRGFKTNISNVEREISRQRSQYH